MTTDKLCQEPPRPTILCVEDEAELRHDMAEELNEAGYRVIEAVDGHEALDQIGVMRPDLILCDINMPGFNGYEVLKTMRDRHPEYAEIPFIFLTALADPREVVEGKRSGADDYLVKPIDYDLLLATVESRLRQIDRIKVQRDAELECLRIALSDSSNTGSTGWNNGIEQALDLISTGIVLIDRSGNTCIANRAARKICADTLEIKRGEPVRAIAASHRERLKAVIGKITAQASENQASVLPCSLPRAPAQRDLMVVACSISNPSSTQKGQPVAGLFITDPDKRPRLSASVLSSLFGLTPTEAEIALELADGKKAADIAATLGIASTTIAFHMRNLFQKTNTNRQAELVALILAGPLTSPSHVRT